MSNKNTKEIIMEALLTLAREKPVEKITVKDIVELCGVNRNTFYYHFQDIPQVVEYLIRDQVNKLVLSKREDEALSSFFLRFMSYLYSNKKTVLHIYRSLKRESFLKYLHELLFYMGEQLQNHAQLKDFTEEERSLLMFFTTCLLEGVLIEWMSADMSQDFYEKAGSIACLLGEASPDVLRLICQTP